ncbi:MAG: hypothetical protein AMS27_03815 [Bacteroides sp. SM23_62_1]|nr:MAG: hypothetical protein AMS27_03815 [Bacteroides sp. SM23_62_1]
MKHFKFFFIFILLLFFLFPKYQANCQTPAHTLLISTSLGDIKIALYEESPLHTENFLNLVKDGYFNGQLFHRVINDFMIQAGDPSSRDAKPGEIIGLGSPGYTIPAEFHPSLYHKKGAVGAARQGDDINPQRASSGSQFYIVQGTLFTDNQLDIMEQRNLHIRFTQEQRNVYKTIGGTPHLDYGYTVFGEVISGLDVVDRIAAVSTDSNNRPLKDIRIKIQVID